MYYHSNTGVETCQDRARRFSRTDTIPSHWYDCPDAAKCDYTIRFDDGCKTIPTFAVGDYVYLPGGVYNYGDSTGSTSITRWTYSQCGVCPANSVHAKTGQSSIDACECTPGYTRISSPGECEAQAQLAAGTWTGCRGDTAKVDHVSGGVCQDSEQWHTLAYGCTVDDSTNEWNWNWYTAGIDTARSRHCRQCSPGTYKNDTGNGDCDACPPDASHDMYGSLTIFDCKCNGNLYNDFHPIIHGSTATPLAFIECQPCRAGYFIDPVSLLCLPCAPGTVSTTTGVAACTSCPDGMHSFRGTTACFDLTHFLHATECACGGVP